MRPACWRARLAIANFFVVRSGLEIRASEESLFRRDAAATDAKRRPGFQIRHARRVRYPEIIAAKVHECYVII